MAKKAALGAAALIGLAAIVYCAIWWTSAEWLRGELDGWAADMRGRGWTVSYERMRIEGFPASLTAIVDAPSIAAPETSGGWSWQGPQIAAKVRPWNTGRIEFQGAGVHRIRTAGAGREPIRVTAGSAFGLILRLAEARATKIALGLGNVAIDAPGHALPRKFKEADATILVPERPGRADEGRGPEPPGPTIAVSLGEIEFGGTQSDAHGRAIEEASLTAKLIGPPPRDARAGSLAVWRDGGGTVEIGEISIVWQKANGKGSGTVCARSRSSAARGAFDPHRRARRPAPHAGRPGMGGEARCRSDPPRPRSPGARQHGATGQDRRSPSRCRTVASFSARSR